MADKAYDVVIIGGGPGGYVAAIRAAQLGMRVACVEMRGSLGGTCLNVGCIPSKALLQSSERYHQVTHGLAAHGIKVASAELDLAAMMGRKDKVVTGLTQGIEHLFKKNKIDYLKGRGHIEAPGRVAVALNEGGAQTLETRNIIIATGSTHTDLPGITIDEKSIVSSTGALSLDKVPEHLVVIGGGVIGLELGSVWGRLGAKVTVVEFLDRLIPTMDGDLSKEFQKVLKKQGFTFKLATKVTGAESSAEGAVTLSMEPAAGGDSATLTADCVLVAIGRRPYTEGLGLEHVGVETGRGGVIPVDAHFKTNIDGIYAIGDVIPGPMLAHKAEEDGVACVELLAGQAGHVDYNLVPSIVYTWPEVAAVGKTEAQLKEEGIDYKSGRFPFMANSRARATGDGDGFVKILADAKTDRVLGVHIIGPNAGDMIHECAMAMAFGGSAEDIARTCHGHPTFNEAVKEAALAVGNAAIHI